MVAAAAAAELFNIARDERDGGWCISEAADSRVSESHGSGSSRRWRSPAAVDEEETDGATADERRSIRLLSLFARGSGSGERPRFDSFSFAPD